MLETVMDLRIDSLKRQTARHLVEELLKGDIFKGSEVGKTSRYFRSKTSIRMGDSGRITVRVHTFDGYGTDCY